MGNRNALILESLEGDENITGDIANGFIGQLYCEGYGNGPVAPSYYADGAFPEWSVLINDLNLFRRT